MKKIVLIALITALSSILLADSNDPNIFMKQNLREVKRELIAQNIKLNDSKMHTLFWTIYNEYEAATKKEYSIYLKKMNVYASNISNMTSELADDMVTESLRMKNIRLKLLERAYKKICSKITAVEAAKFYQIENRFGLMIDLQLASGLPMILPETSAVDKPKRIFEVRVEK